VVSAFLQHYRGATGNNPVLYADPTGFTTYVGNADINGIPAWLLGIPYLHAYIEVDSSTNSRHLFEYGPTGDSSDPLIPRPDYGTNKNSPQLVGNPQVLPPINGLSGDALDEAVIATFNEVDSFLKTANVPYSKYNSNAAIAAGLFMLGYSESDIARWVSGPGNLTGESATSLGKQLANMILHSYQSQQSDLGLMGSNGLDYCDSCQLSGQIKM
jgi:hypothetical protein